VLFRCHLRPQVLYVLISVSSSALMAILFDQADIDIGITLQHANVSGNRIDIIAQQTDHSWCIVCILYAPAVIYNSVLC